VGKAVGSKEAETSSFKKDSLIAKGTWDDVGSPQIIFFFCEGEVINWFSAN
jgi:hypothetical protein